MTIESEGITIPKWAQTDDAHHSSAEHTATQMNLFRINDLPLQTESDAFRMAFIFYANL